LPKIADIGSGSRFFGRPHRSLYYHHYIGNRMISILFNILYNQMVSDLDGLLQDVPARSVAGAAPDSGRLGFEIEISAQIALARHWCIYKAGIRYYDRTYDEGKKINWRDGIEALFYLLKLRLGGAWFRPKILSE
jgi:hypothetical protein